LQGCCIAAVEKELGAVIPLLHHSNARTIAAHAQADGLGIRSIEAWEWYRSAISEVDQFNPLSTAPLGKAREPDLTEGWVPPAAG
jgi:hypothetical protein